MNEWKSPSSASGWTNSNNARDGDTGTKARDQIDYYSWSPWLACEFAGDGFYSTKIRFWLSHASSKIEIAQVRALVDGVWQYVHYDDGPWNVWVEVDLLTPGTITKIDIREKSGTGILKYNGYVNEVEAWEAGLPVQAYAFVM